MGGFAPLALRTSVLQSELSSAFNRGAQAHQISITVCKLDFSIQTKLSVILQTENEQHKLGDNLFTFMVSSTTPAMLVEEAVCKS